MTSSSKSTTYWNRICTVSSKFNRITKKVIKSKDQSIIVVIAGGDGSMAKLIDDLIRESIDTSRIKVLYYSVLYITIWNRKRFSTVHWLGK